MSDPSDIGEHDHAAELPCEPDDIPVRFLAIIVGGVTLFIVALIAIAVWAFDHTSAAEMKAKGYDVGQTAPSQAAPTQDTPPAGAHK